MKSVIQSDWYWYASKGWAINTTISGVRTDIMDRILSQLTAMFSFHWRLFVFRFDLHQPDYTGTNKRITVFNRRLFKRIKRHYQSRVGFCWVREQEKAKQQHYHYVIILDGNKVRDCYMLKQWITEIWESLDGTSIHWSGYHNISRGDDLGIQSCSYHISYLAKPRGKGYRPVQTKDFGASRLKHKPHNNKSLNIRLTHGSL